jgi:hypothetical protein
VKDDQELGELIFDSNPFNSKLLIFGIISLIIGVPLIIYGRINEDDTIFFLGLIIIIFLSGFFFVSISAKEKYRFRIFKHGLKIISEKYSKDPVQNPLGIRIVGKRIVKYEDIISIHPYAFKFRKNPNFNSIGLLIVLPKEKDNHIAGKILVTGKKMKTMPEIISLLKEQMGSLWGDKYKRDEPIWSGSLDSNKVAEIVEFGENP